MIKNTEGGSGKKSAQEIGVQERNLTVTTSDCVELSWVEAPRLRWSATFILCYSSAIFRGSGRSANRHHGYAIVNNNLRRWCWPVCSFFILTHQKCQKKPAVTIIQNGFKLPMVEMLRRRKPLCRLVCVAMVVGVAVLVISTKHLSSIWSGSGVPASRRHASCKLVNCRALSDLGTGYPVAVTRVLCALFEIQA